MFLRMRLRKFCVATLLRKKKHSYVCTRIKGWGKEEKERERGRMSKRGKERERIRELMRLGERGGGVGEKFTYPSLQIISYKEDGIQKIQRDRKVEIVKVRVEEGRDRHKDTEQIVRRGERYQEKETARPLERWKLKGRHGYQNIEVYIKK